MNLRQKIKELEYQQYDTENFYSVEWIDYKVITYAESFRKYFNEIYEIDLKLLFIILIGMEFMGERLDCTSCPVTEKWFEEFSLYIVNK